MLMTSIKIIGFKIVLLIGFFVLANFVYKHTLFEKDIQAYSPVIDLVRTVVKDGAEIIYLGESSNNTIRSDDQDKRSISEMISAYYPSKKFGHITKEASHAGIFFDLLQNIPDSSAVKTVIVTLNLRSFDAGWIFSDLETPLQQSMVLLKPYPPLFNRFLLAFKAYDIKTNEERERQFKTAWKNETLVFPEPFKYKNTDQWNKGIAYSGIKNPDGSWNTPMTELACHYVKTYAFQINTETNPRIKDFDRITALAKKRNWNLVFNLLAENVDKADSLVGKELIYLINQNRNVLVSRYQSMNVLVVDNLEKVGDAEFIDRSWTTEHYAEKGRKIVARSVAKALKQIYPSDYSDTISQQQVRDEFFSDCETPIDWGQMNTLTSSNSFSGKFSSLTGQNHDFSLTFEQSLENLPETMNKVEIEFQVFQTNLNHDAKLVIELRGQRIAFSWNGFKLNELSRKEKVWDKVNYQFLLPDNYVKAEIIKVYLFNPTSTSILIDDLRVKFKP